MKTVRKEMNVGDLKGIIDLPDYDDNQRVEITVAPVEPVAKRKKMTPEEIEAALGRLTGCLKGLVDPTKDMAYWRGERLAEKHGLKFAD
jgi:starvation-inducible outer membrane lipoprotein